MTKPLKLRNRSLTKINLLRSSPTNLIIFADGASTWIAGKSGAEKSHNWKKYFLKDQSIAEGPRQ